MENIIRKRRRIVINFSLPFLFFIIIPVLILNIAIWLAIRITENNERQNCINSLAEGSGKMEARIRDIQNVVTLLRRDDYLYALDRLGADIAVKDQYSVWLALQSLVNLDISRRGLDMMVYCQNADLVLSPNFMASNMSGAWGSGFRFGDYDHSGFLAAFCVPSYRPVYFPDMELIWEKVSLRGMLYGIQLHIGRELFVFFLLRDQQIQEYFAPVLSGGGALYIYDASGGLLYSRGGGFPPGTLEPEHFTGSGLLPASFGGPGITGAYSRPENGLLYISVLKADTAFSHVQYLWNTALVLNVIAIVLSLGYALFLGAWNSRQIGEAFQLLDNTPGFPSYKKGNIMRYLGNSVSRLINTNTRLREDADSRRGILRIALIDRLLNDERESYAEIAADAEQSGLTVDGRRFCAIFLVMHIPENNRGGGNTPIGVTRGAWRDIQRILETALPPDEALIYNRNPSRTGIFFFLTGEHWEDFRDYIEGLFQTNIIPRLRAAVSSFHIAGSSLYGDIFALKEGFRLCREYTLVSDNGEETRIHWIDMVTPPASRRIFAFSLDIEQKLINQLQNANFEDVHNTLRGVFAANTRGSQLSERMLRIFYTNLQSCFLKSLEEPLTDFWRDAIEDMDFNLLPREVEETFIELARSICDSSHAEYSKKNTFIKKEELTGYVEKHFGEERLSLSLAARHFGFSEPYFSQMFKEITGENFSTFTEFTRMGHAQTLLKQYLKVEEVAYRCGYSSPNTFRRAYKRHFGIPPTLTTGK